MQSDALIGGNNPAATASGKAVPAAVNDLHRAPQLGAIQTYDALFAVWLLGVGIFLFSILRNLRWWSRCIRRASVCSNSGATEQLRACCREIGIAPPPVLLETSQVSAPAVCGVFRPAIILPRGFVETYSPAELRLIFVHELMHVKRHDILIGWITAFLQALHWFNPVLWHGFHRMRIDRELARDAEVLARTGQEQAADYGRLLLTISQASEKQRLAFGAAGVVENKSQLRKRVVHITQFGARRVRLSVIAILATGVISVLSFTGAQPAEMDAATAPFPAVGVSSDKSDTDDRRGATLPPRNQMPFSLTVAPDGELLYNFEADTITPQSIVATKDVVFVDEASTITCDRLSYDLSKNEVTATGTQVLTKDGLRYSGDSLTYDLTKAEYTLEGNALLYNRTRGGTTTTHGDKITIRTVNERPQVRLEAKSGTTALKRSPNSLPVTTSAPTELDAANGS